MNNDKHTQKYQTHQLPQYVLRHFGGARQITLEKIKDGVWKFSGGGTEVVLNADSVIHARERIKKIVQNLDPRVAKDRRVVKEKPRLN